MAARVRTGGEVGKVAMSSQGIKPTAQPRGQARRAEATGLSPLFAAGFLLTFAATLVGIGSRYDTVDGLENSTRSGGAPHG